MRRSLRYIRSALSFIIVFLAIPVSSHAQDGQIAGTVRTANGSPLSSARITVTNTAGAVTRSASTASDGSYRVTRLPDGSYTVSGASVGYRPGSKTNVRVPESAAVDFTLEVLPLQAVTVTATLREQEIADVPFSIAAPTASVLRERGADNIEAIAANVAGFSVQNLGPGQSQVAMRGASAGQIARDQPGVKESVGIYLDGSPVSLSLFTPDADLFDV